MPKKETVANWKKQASNTDILGIKAEEHHTKMELRISQEAQKADLVLLICLITLFLFVLFVFVLCFETWAVDSPVGFWVLDRKKWGL